MSVGLAETLTAGLVVVLGIVDRLVAVPAGGCACWWLSLLQRLVAVPIGLTGM